MFRSVLVLLSADGIRYEIRTCDKKIRTIAPYTVGHIDLLSFSKSNIPTIFAGILHITCTLISLLKRDENNTWQILGITSFYHNDTVNIFGYFDIFKLNSEFISHD